MPISPESIKLSSVTHSPRSPPILLLINDLSFALWNNEVFGQLCEITDAPEVTSVTVYLLC